MASSDDPEFTPPDLGCIGEARVYQFVKKFGRRLFGKVRIGHDYFNSSDVKTP